MWKRRESAPKQQQQTQQQRKRKENKRIEILKNAFDKLCYDSEDGERRSQRMVIHLLLRLIYRERAPVCTAARVPQPIPVNVSQSWFVRVKIEFENKALSASAFEERSTMNRSTKIVPLPSEGACVCVWLCTASREPWRKHKSSLHSLAPPSAHTTTLKSQSSARPNRFEELYRK